MLDKKKKSVFDRATDAVTDLVNIKREGIPYYIIMVALWNRADHYIFVLWFLSFFFPSPNLSRRRLDVYHTSSHGVALVRI